MSKISIKPLADRVLVEPSEAETKTSSGIIIPDSAKEKPQRGKIVAVGPGTKENPVTLKSGDIVLYGKYAGTELHHNGCLLYTSPSPRDRTRSRMPSSA